MLLPNVPTSLQDVKDHGFPGVLGVEMAFIILEGECGVTVQLLDEDTLVVTGIASSHTQEGG